MQVFRAIAAGDIAAGTPETAPAAGSALWKQPLFMPVGHDSLEFIFSTLTKADPTDVPEFAWYIKHRGADDVVTVSPYKRLAIASGQTFVERQRFAKVPQGVSWAVIVDVLPTSDDVACTIFWRSYKDEGA